MSWTGEMVVCQPAVTITLLSPHTHIETQRHTDTQTQRDMGRMTLAPGLIVTASPRPGSSSVRERREERREESLISSLRIYHL